MRSLRFRRRLERVGQMAKAIRECLTLILTLYELARRLI
jgi:hypothetical protein